MWIAIIGLVGILGGALLTFASTRDNLRATLRVKEMESASKAQVETVAYQRETIALLKEQNDRLQAQVRDMQAKLGEVERRPTRRAP